jgi:hypothetical protein
MSPETGLKLRPEEAVRIQSHIGSEEQQKQYDESSRLFDQVFDSYKELMGARYRIGYFPSSINEFVLELKASMVNPNPIPFLNELAGKFRDIKRRFGAPLSSDKPVYVVKHDKTKRTPSQVVECFIALVTRQGALAVFSNTEGKNRGMGNYNQNNVFTTKENAQAHLDRTQKP